MKRDIFIGGAWPYSNYFLHVGHTASLLPGDILAKYFRINGDNVIYVSGSDCHGTPITERAKKEGKTPIEVATFYHEEFKKSFINLGFEYDMYANTMEDFHEEYVEKCFKRLIDNGFIYEKEEEQDYCENCNKFLADREIIGICPRCGGESTGDQCENCDASLNASEVKDKKCKTCGMKTTTRLNKHLYFKLTSFKDELQELLNKNKDKWRNNAVGEAQKFLDSLVDRAATRQLDWGVKVPVDGYEDKRIYVWFEAVLGYMSVGNEVAKKRNINFDEFMSDKNEKLSTYYIHGKDNIPFHTIIYPALLSGLKMGYRYPDYIVSCAYVNLNNEKMSKSKGNLITANELLSMFDSDTIRFFLTLYGPEKNDCNCSLDAIVQAHNKFLVGTIGNFINRNLSFVNKKFDGLIKEGKIDESIISETKNVFDRVSSLIEKAELKSAITEIIDYAMLGNKYYDEHTPWVSVKENIDEFNNTTYTCVYIMNNLSKLLYPFCPKGSKKIRKMLNLDDNVTWGEETISGDIQIKDLEILYNRLDEIKNTED